MWNDSGRPASPFPISHSNSTRTTATTSSFDSSQQLSPALWEKDNWTSFTIWDIERTFQEASEAYEQVLLKNRKKRSRFEACFGIGKSEDDELAESLTLGKQVQDILELGRSALGSRFEKGDSICHSILSAQLLRTQQEIHSPLLNYSLARTTSTFALPPALTISIITAAKAVRRTCLQALRAQFDRMRTLSLPFLPPPRFKVAFCPFALKVQKERGFPHILTKKLRPTDRYDERETCPGCQGVVPVSAHSGLPDARRLLFQSHLKPEAHAGKHKQYDEEVTFACTSCYKTFESSYGFLDHVYQREMGTERSCLKKYEDGNRESYFSSSLSLDENWGRSESGGSSLIDQKEKNEAMVSEVCLTTTWKRSYTWKRGMSYKEWEI